MSDIDLIPSNVASAFAKFSLENREALFAVRAMIFEVAMTDPRIGPVEETLRWGEPAYITRKKRTGSTIRLGVEKVTTQPALFFDCKTSVVEEMRGQFGALLTYSKNRAVLLDTNSEEAKAALRMGIASALTYHLRD